MSFLVEELKQLRQDFDNADFNLKENTISVGANHQIAYRKALAWLGHSSSEMLDLYYHLHDEDSQQAMMALANSHVVGGSFNSQDSPCEGNLRANGQSKIEKTLQVPEVKELVETLSNITERAGFEPAVRCTRTHAFQACSISRSDTSPDRQNGRIIVLKTVFN